MFFGRPAWAWMVAAFAVLYAARLGTPELTPIDESRTAMIARDMIQGGNWLLPRTPDGCLSEKPLLYYGLAAGVMGIVGEGEWPLRCVSVLMAVATLLVVGLSAGAAGTPRASALAVGVLGSNLLFTAWARSAMVDMTFTFFLTVGMAGYLAARLGRISPGRATALCGVSFGLAVLTKGPLGLAIPASAAIVDMLISTRGRFWRARIPWSAAAVAVALVVAISLLWYLPGALAGGSEFLHTSLLDENVYMPLGLSHGIAGSHTKPVGYYPSRQLMILLPAVALLPEAIRRFFRREAGLSGTVLASWAAGGFLVLMAASNKRWYYLLPLQPAMALLIARLIDSIRESESPALLRWGTRTMGVLMAAGALIVASCAFTIPGSAAAGAGKRLLDLMREHQTWIALVSAGVSWAGIVMIASSFGPVSSMIRSIFLAGLVAAGLRSFLIDPMQGKQDRVQPFIAEMTRIVPREAPVAVWPPGYGYGFDVYWPPPLERGIVAANSAEYLLVRKSQIPELPFPVEILGVVEFSSEKRHVALVRRK